MTSSLNYRERQRVDSARNLLEKAVSHDERGNLALALSHYLRGLEYLIPLLYSPRCTGRVRVTLRQKCRQYLDRARKLKDVIRSRRDATNGYDVNPDITDREGVAAEGGGGEVEETERPVNMDRNLEERESRKDDDADQGSDRRCATNHINTETENSSALNIGQPRQAAHEHSDAYVSDCQAEGLKSPAASGHNEMSDKSTEARDQQDDLSEDQMPQTLAVTLDAMLVRTDSTTCTTQAACRWLQAPGVGLEELEMNLKEIVLLPLLFPQLFSTHTFYRRSRLLLYGHSGDGAMPLLHHFIRLCNTLTLLTISAHSLVSLVMAGEQGRDVIAALWSRACTTAPCALCVTDMEVFGSEFDDHEDSPYPQDLIRKLLIDLICQLENVHDLKELVIFIGVTSRPWLMNWRLRRRFDLRRFCPPPSLEQRAAVLMSALEGVSHQLDHRDLRQIATLTSTFTRSDMAVLAEEAQARMKQRVQEARFFRTVTVHRHHNAVAMPCEENNSTGQDDEAGSEDGAEADGSDERIATGDRDDARNNYSHQKDGQQCSSGHVGPTKRSQATPNAVSDLVLYTPCDVTDSDAIAMMWQDVEGHQLLEPSLTLQDVMMALTDLNGQVGHADRQRMTLWHEDYGQY